MKKNITPGVGSTITFPPAPSINYHLWKSCDMSCKFCFATFQEITNKILPKGHLPKEKSIELVQTIADSGFEKITFAGGEPMLCPWLDQLLATAKSAGMTTMIVSNGSKITQEWLRNNAPNIDWLTLSIDSLCDETNRKAGRVLKGKKQFGKAELSKIIAWTHELGIRLKINSVVHAENHGEDLSEFIRETRPERWKIFQVLPIEGQSDLTIKDLLVSSQQFNSFVERHQALADVTKIVPESNDAMTSSYIMVDPAGCFFDNSLGSLSKSEPILETGIQKAFSQVQFDCEKFTDRKGYYNWKEQPQKIALSGFAGTGKSSIGKELARQLDYSFISIGELARAEAQKRGLNIQELQSVLEQEGTAFDKYLDQKMVDWAKENDKWVMDYRLGFHFIPEAYSILLEVPPGEAAHRIRLENRKHEFPLGSKPKKIEETIERRNTQMQNRFLQTYNVDFADPKNHQFSLNTSGKTIQESVDAIRKHF